MRQVTSHALWIGNVGDLRDLSRLRMAGIKAIVDLAIDEPPAGVGRELCHLRFPLLDGVGNEPWLLRAAVDSVASLIRSRTPTLVYCSGGMSRSPSIAAMALSLASGRPASECFALVVSGGPADVSGGLWEAVQAAASRPHCF